ncbi:hypothetical protein J6R97_02080 [bacterium]|nr:hypothetical protein [bacterium]
MIKEKKRKVRIIAKKNPLQILKGYLRTFFFSFIIGSIITIGFVIQARNKTLDDIYAYNQRQSSIDKSVAQELVKSSNLLSDLNRKKYSVCMYVGEIYEAIGNYQNAQEAYQLAIEKAKVKNYAPYFKLIKVLVAQEKFLEANSILDSIKDKTDKDLIKFKTNSYIIIGDKYYSNAKFLSAVKCYEKAGFYYNKFAKKDLKIDNSIKERIVNSYIQTADILVKSGLNSEAIKFLKRAEKYAPDDYNVKYKLAIIFSDLDPELSVDYFEELLDKIPQKIDYEIYNTALMKSANIADLDNRPTRAKYYRYKIRSIDMFINRKVVYKNDIECFVKSFKLEKIRFHYPLKITYAFFNVSNSDIINLKADFILRHNEKPIETLTIDIANKNKPLFIAADNPNLVDVCFKKKIFSKKDLEEYTIEIYIYKDLKYKTFVSNSPLPINIY